MMSLRDQVHALNNKVEALLSLMAASAPKAVRKQTRVDPGVILLSASEAAHQHIATKKPHLKRPTWVYLGKDVTCVWPLLDVVFGIDKRQDMKKKAVAYIREHGLGWQTVGHKAHSDQGPVPVPKMGGIKSLMMNPCMHPWRTSSAQWCL